jgi:HEAT repeat protein
MGMRALLLALWLAAGLAAQDLAAPEGIPDLGDPCCTGGRTEGPLPTLEQMLERRGIQLTKQGLLSALLDLRAVVRSLAARKLAQDALRDSIPAIAAALSVEEAPGTREILAASLASLGEEQGFAALRDMCKANFPAGLRRFAASDMLQLHNEECVGDLVNVLRFVRDSAPGHPLRDNFLQVGLYDLDTFPPQHPTERQQADFRELAVSCLASKSRDIRIAASRVLGTFGDGTSAQELQRAVAVEEDRDVRTRMLADLQRLKDRQHEPGGDHN